MTCSFPGRVASKFKLAWMVNPCPSNVAGNGGSGLGPKPRSDAVTAEEEDARANTAERSRVEGFMVLRCCVEWGLFWES